MLFRPELIEAIKNRQKWQTRRLVKSNDITIGSAIYDGQNHNQQSVQCFTPTGRRIRWEVGKTYAICPGRGKPGVGRIKIVAIRGEHIRTISDEDLLAEGIDFTYIGSDQKEVRRWKFQQLWDRINSHPGTRWADNPAVWVLTFELVK